MISSDINITLKKKKSVCVTVDRNGCIITNNLPTHLVKNCNGIHKMLFRKVSFYQDLVVCFFVCLGNHYLFLL